MRKLARVLLIVNFVLLLLLIGHGSNYKLYLAEQRLGIADIIFHSLQFWFIASTLLAVVLFVWTLISRSEGNRTQRPTKLDWALLVSWISVIAIMCLWALVIGTGG